MSVMSAVEARFCRSAPWRGFARHVVLPWALRDVQVGDNVLEIGGGSGAMAYELLRREPQTSLTVTDLDPAMVAAAGKRLKPFGQRATVLEGDASALEFDNDSFDTVFTWLMLHHTIEWQKVLDEAVRVLRPGGHLIGYDLVNTRTSRLVHRLDGSPHRFFNSEQLRSGLAHAEAEPIHTTRGFGGLVVRFAARKLVPE